MGENRYHVHVPLVQTTIFEVLERGSGSRSDGIHAPLALLAQLPATL